MRLDPKSGLVLGLFCLLGVWPCGCASPDRAATPNLPIVVLETEFGELLVEVDSIHAPVTASNFLRYVDGSFYDGGFFHRTVRADNQPDNAIRIAVIQGGMNPARENESFPPIPLERTSKTGLRHLDATISMARDGPATATADFFVCVGDQPALDFGGQRNPDGQGFAAFGRVIGGMDLVRRVHAAPAQEQKLMPPIRILRARRVRP